MRSENEIKQEIENITFKINAINKDLSEANRLTDKTALNDLRTSLINRKITLNWVLYEGGHVTDK